MAKTPDTKKPDARSAPLRSITRPHPNRPENPIGQPTMVLNEGIIEDPMHKKQGKDA